MAHPKDLVFAPIHAGLELGRRVLIAVPGATRAIAGLVRTPERESGWPDDPAVKADGPVRPRRDRTPPVAEPPVYQGAEVVASIAEPGAETGAGPELQVAEPWDGYRQMQEGRLVERLNDASAEEAAAVQLYEGLHGGRRAVLDAAARRLEMTAGS